MNITLEFLLSGLCFVCFFGGFDIQAVIFVTHCTEPDITVVSYTSRPFSAGKDLNLSRSITVFACQFTNGSVYGTFCEF